MIVERRHRAIGQRPLDTALDGLMVRAHSPPHRKKRRVFPVGQQHPRSFDPARRFARNAARSTSPIANSIDRRNPAITSKLASEWKAARLQAMPGKLIRAHDWFQGIEELVVLSPFT